MDAMHSGFREKLCPRLLLKAKLEYSGQTINQRYGIPVQEESRRYELLIIQMREGKKITEYDCIVKLI